MQSLIASHLTSLLATVTNASYNFMIHIDCAFLKPAWLQNLATQKIPSFIHQCIANIYLLTHK